VFFATVLTRHLFAEIHIAAPATPLWIELGRQSLGWLDATKFGGCIGMQL
tara:strand:- start:635 stop:784 length:150 start_codon:yes stop_codon:yes gene_type:complete